MSESREANGLNGHAMAGASNASSSPDIETDLLIVGTGPAGASLACFLASYG